MEPPDLRKREKQRIWKMEPRVSDRTIILLTHLCLLYLLNQKVTANSINYGISQRPITDISQLMPSLCQNQSVICEGSFCIPGLRRCVCDLRQPVQFGRFCLRQVDIETKCFVTNQCNHTIRDAVCVDTNSNTILDVDSSRFRLEQWQQLNELRQASKSTLSKQETARQKVAAATSRLLKPVFQLESAPQEAFFEARDDVILSSFRNSPYEINYYTPELLHQNHTRRKTTTTTSTDATSNGERSPEVIANDTQIGGGSRQMPADGTLTTSLIERSTQSSEVASVSTASSRRVEEIQPSTSTSAIHNSPLYDLKNAEASTSFVSESVPTTTQQTTTLTSELSRKKMIVKTPSWPPGVCSCPPGHMFDSMLRKCLALSLADSHCLSDNDCKQIGLTHCSSETRKCECDEPLIWNQTELACQRPRPANKLDTQASSQSKEGFFENLLPPLLMAKVSPDQSMLLMIFVILVIIATLLLLRCVVKCFSSSNSALISPKNSKRRKSAGGDHGNNFLAPKSPYATLRKAEQHKANTPLANFTQATRGRILNYDFEQDQPMPDSRSPQSPQPQMAGYVSGRDDQQQHQQQSAHRHHQQYDTLDKTAVGGTLSRQKQSHKRNGGAEEGSSHQFGNSAGAPAGECLELKDNVSLDGQLDSERKSESGSLQAVIGPPPSQTPPYMLASAMKGQGSAIAAAAAAVANRRMQMAHNKGLADSNAGKVPNGKPVFL